MPIGTQHSFAFVVVLLVFVRITDGAEKYQPGLKLNIKMNILPQL